MLLISTAIELITLFYCPSRASGAYCCRAPDRCRSGKVSDMLLGDTFGSTFTRNLTDRMLAALARAYETACEHHVPKRGSTEQMFGFNLYGFALHELVQEFGGPGGVVRVKSERPMFRLLANDYEIACHRVGQRATQDILTCFPNNEGALHTMHEVQLWLQGVDLGLDKARKLVLAHLGNDEDGFEAAYLCFPGSTAKQKITSWAHAHPLWVKESAASSQPVAIERVPEERIEEARPRRRSKKDARDGQGAD